MDILFLLIPLSVVLALFIGAAFWMAVDGGQFDDLEGPGLRVVVDDDTPATARGPRVSAGTPPTPCEAFPKVRERA
jgi:cbb3-type cytochrome oxidase maturation protein